MSFGSFMKNMGSRIGRGIENMATERARRLNNPAFQAELLRSRNEFVNHVTEAGSSALTGIYRFFLEAPIATTAFAINSALDSRIPKGAAVTKMFTEFGGAFNALGQSVLHTLRALGR